MAKLATLATSSGKRLLEGIADYAIQALLYAWAPTALGVAAAVWAFLSGYEGPWLYVLYGALGAFIFTVLALSILVAVQTRRRRVLERLKKTAEKPEEKGVLDFLVERERALDEGVKIMAKITNHILWMGKRMKYRNTQLQRLRASGGGQNAAKQLRLAGKTARDLEKNAAQMEKLFAALDDTTQVIYEGTMGFVKYATSRGTIDQQQATAFREHLRSFRETLREYDGQQRSYIESLRGMRGIAQVVNAASAKLMQIHENGRKSVDRLNRMCVEADRLFGPRRASN